MALSLGSSNETVRAVQRILATLGYRFLRVRPRPDGPRLICKLVHQDGIFGPETQAVLMDFQRDNALLVDGAVGKTTMAALEAAYARRRLEIDSPGTDALDAFARDGTVSRAAMRLPFMREPADLPPGFEDACEAVQLRSDAAAAYRCVYDALKAAGAATIVGGGRRALDTPVSEARSALSFNHIGRGIELFRFAGMIDPENDPYVIELTEAGRVALEWRDNALDHLDVARQQLLSMEPPKPWFWRVWARCANSGAAMPETTIGSVVTYDNRRPPRDRSVTGTFVDLTAAFAAVGFFPVPARQRFFDFNGEMLDAEWWRFQFESGLVPEVSTYGGELLRVYSESTLAGTPPWQFRRWVYVRDWGISREG